MPDPCKARIAHAKALAESAFPDEVEEAALQSKGSAHSSAGSGAKLSVVADSAARSKATTQEQQLTPARTVLGILGVIASLYVFLVGLTLMSDGFQALSGRSAGRMFSGVQNPIAGLMVGILATVLVQSSSTSTSIVVGLVGADQVTVQVGIPIIMGANIGTCMTSTVVSMWQSGDPIQLERSFAGATVHDLFNVLTVMTLLPLELISGDLLGEGEGGFLYWLTKWITEKLMGGGHSSLFRAPPKSPSKVVAKPASQYLININKEVIKAQALAEPKAVSLSAEQVNATRCALRRRLADEGAASAAPEEAPRWASLRSAGPSQTPLSRRLADRPVSSFCSRYDCVSPELDTMFKKINERAYNEDLTPCDGYLSIVPDCSEGHICYMDAGVYYQSQVLEGRHVNGGVLENLSDFEGGVITLLLALLMLCLGLFGLCRLLQFLLIRKAKKLIARAIGMHDAVQMVLGVLITFSVQSSSVVTSALTPLCGLGIIPLDKMLPITLGANIGTTVTALIAALASMKFGALQIALCHLWINILGILIWYPLKLMRQVPLRAAMLLGLYASFYRLVPIFYIFMAFIIVPWLLLCLSALFEISVTGGAAVLTAMIVAVLGFEYWWIKMEGCYKVLSEEYRKKRIEEKLRSDSDARGEDPIADLPQPPFQDSNKALEGACNSV